jgi:hypothetical protein
MSRSATRPQAGQVWTRSASVLDTLSPHGHVWDSLVVKVEAGSRRPVGLLALAADRGDEPAGCGGLQGFAPQEIPRADVAVLGGEVGTVVTHDALGDAAGAVVLCRGRGRRGLGEACPVAAVAGRQIVSAVRLLRHPGLVRGADTAWDLDFPFGEAGSLAACGAGLLPC